MESDRKNNVALERYNLSVRRHVWGSTCFKKLRHESSRVNNTNVTAYSWDRKLSFYYIELFNFPDDKEALFAAFVSSTAKAFGLSVETVVEIIGDSHRKSDVNEDEIPPLFIETSPSSRVSRVSCGKYISYEISTRSLNQLRDDPHFLETFINYSSLNPNAGSFWSLGPALYQVLEASEKNITSVECFASPFNYNLKAFCSAFASDRRLDYGEDVRCYGDFFSYIKRLQNHSDPVRLICNPPYTDRIIDAMAAQVVAYMQNHPLGEFISILPDWTDQPGIVSLASLQGSVTHSFGPNEFNFWDPIEDSVLPANFKIIAVVNIGHNEKRSQTKLDEILQTMNLSSTTD